MATKKSKTPAPTAPEDKTKTLRIMDGSGKTHDRMLAEIAADGVATGACLLVDFGKGAYGTLSLTDAVRVVDDTAKAVHGGNLKGAETMLIAQAVALNAIFGELARRSATNMGEYLDASERYMRLALKAQGQCRATLETLAVIKNPPVVFARQMNVAHGPQQVNNSGVPAHANDSAQAREGARAHAGKPKPDQTGLLEVSGGQRLDTRAPGKAGGADPHLAPVGAVHRAAHR